METVKLKESLKTLLETNSEGKKAYEYTRVPKTAAFPYVTYNLTTSTESMRDPITDVDYTLELDILDYRQDKNTDGIEALLDSVNAVVNRKDVIETDFYYRIERTAVLTQLPTVDEYHFRRQIVCILRYMERSD